MWKCLSTLKHEREKSMSKCWVVVWRMCCFVKKKKKHAESNQDTPEPKAHYVTTAEQRYLKMLFIIHFLDVKTSYFKNIYIKSAYWHPWWVWYITYYYHIKVIANLYIVHSFHSTKNIFSLVLEFKNSLIVKIP